MSGNAIINANPITKHDYQQITNNLKTLLPDGLPLYPFGSAGKKEISGDVDFFIDADELLTFIPSSRHLSILDCRKHLYDYFIDKKLKASRTGINVHIGVPLNDELIQIDLTVVKDAAKIAHLHNHVYDNEDVKGKTIVSIWCDLTNLTSPDLMISPYKGLLNRNTRELITLDPTEIAKIIIGPFATEYDMRSPTRLLEAVQYDPIKYQHIKQTYFK